MRKLGFVLTVLLASVLAACGVLPVSAGDMVQSDLKRDTAPATSAADLQALIEGDSRFAFDVYSQVRAQSGNLVYSPY
ncbi:hypothetical protein EG834_04660, partial [bacterium]|nr:hypothetical protein [bacterium]